MEGDVDQIFGIREDVWIEDGNFRFISIEMVFKFMGLDEVRKGQRMDGDRD